jgi:dihydrofolate reductase
MVGMMHFPKIPVVAVAAMKASDRGIGYQNKLLWHIPEDLKRFKTLTIGHPIIMGRKTFESIVAILGKPLPDRHTIVVTSTPERTLEGAETAGSLEAAFAIAERDEPTEIHIGGGALIYDAALPFIDRLHLTLVETDAEADAFFPDYSKSFSVTSESETKEHDGLRYRFVDLVRSTPTP